MWIVKDNCPGNNEITQIKLVVKSVLLSFLYYVCNVIFLSRIPVSTAGMLLLVFLDIPAVHRPSFYTQFTFFFCVTFTSIN